MRFHHLFRRYKGAVPVGEIALGADADPTASLDPVSLVPGTNVLHARFMNNSGWPPHRIAVGYKGPPGAIALNVVAYIYDGLSNAWYSVGPSGATLVPNAISFFDFVSVPELPTVAQNLDKAVGTSVDVYLRVTDPGAAPAGEHVFVLAPDLTTIGY